MRIHAQVLIATLTRDLGVNEDDLVRVICLPTLLTLGLVASVNEAPLWVISTACAP